MKVMFLADQAAQQFHTWFSGMNHILYILFFFWNSFQDGEFDLIHYERNTANIWFGC
jgi:hypothetical protein